MKCKVRNNLEVVAESQAHCSNIPIFLLVQRKKKGDSRILRKATFMWSTQVTIMNGRKGNCVIVTAKHQLDDLQFKKKH